MHFGTQRFKPVKRPTLSQQYWPRFEGQFAVKGSHEQVQKVIGMLSQQADQENIPLSKFVGFWEHEEKRVEPQQTSDNQSLTWGTDYGAQGTYFDVHTLWQFRQTLPQEVKPPDQEGWYFLSGEDAAKLKTLQRDATEYKRQLLAYDRFFTNFYQKGSNTEYDWQIFMESLPPQPDSLMAFEDHPPQFQSADRLLKELQKGRTFDFNLGKLAPPPPMPQKPFWQQLTDDLKELRQDLKDTPRYFREAYEAFHTMCSEVLQLALNGSDYRVNVQQPVLKSETPEESLELGFK